MDSFKDSVKDIVEEYAVYGYKVYFDSNITNVFTAILSLAYYGYLAAVVTYILMHIVLDVNYFKRTFFTTICGLFDRTYSLRDVTSMYGFGTFQDCGIGFKNVSLPRIIRELDFARYHFYQCSGMYKRLYSLEFSFLQGSTYTVIEEPIPLFWLYKIYSRLVYWDDKSLFIEHEVMTVHDGKVRWLLLSRQHVIPKNENKTPAETLVKGIDGYDKRPPCPEYIKHWLDSCKLSSEKIKSMDVSME